MDPALLSFMIIGVATALNLIFIKVKFEKGRWSDAIFDLFTLILLAVVFSGSYSGVVVATITSLIISIYLFISPPKFTNKMREFFNSF